MFPFVQSAGIAHLFLFNVWRNLSIWQQQRSTNGLWEKWAGTFSVT